MTSDRVVVTWPCPANKAKLPNRSVVCVDFTILLGLGMIHLSNMVGPMQNGGLSIGVLKSIFWGCEHDTYIWIVQQFSIKHCCAVKSRPRFSAPASLYQSIGNWQHCCFSARTILAFPLVSLESSRGEDPVRSSRDILGLLKVYNHGIRF